MSDLTLSPAELAEWTPYKRREHARKFPTQWAEIQKRLGLVKTAPIVEEPKPEPEIVIDWNLIRPEPLAMLRLQFPPRVRVEDIIAACSRFAKVSIAEIKSERRTRHVVVPRHAAMYIAATYTYHSLPAIGIVLGKRDHSTIWHGRNKVSEDLANGGERYGAIVEYVTAKLRLC